ncbi:hypothetical protein [Mesorhizobium amorphae]|uniref:hypothetical protein n=1 Tax=Mesorhizobium amorphae TaxID=71433 RepID=UPI0024E1641E|nr:hypothetical protein [Mesorhizobium amorphae]
MSEVARDRLYRRHRFRVANLHRAGDGIVIFDFDDCGIDPQRLDLAIIGWWLELAAHDGAPSCGERSSLAMARRMATPSWTIPCGGLWQSSTCGRCVSCRTIASWMPEPG